MSNITGTTCIENNTENERNNEITRSVQQNFALERYSQAGYQSDEEEIDLLDMLGHLLLHWKAFLILAVAGAILGGAYGAYLNYGYEKGAVFNEESLVGARAALTEYELNEADQVYNNYHQYVKNVEMEQINLADSYLMHLDPQSSIKEKRVLLVRTGFQSTDSLFTLDNVMGESDYKKISEMLGITGDGKRTIESIVKMTLGGGLDYTDYDLGSDIKGRVDEEYEYLLNISVISSDKDTCAKVQSVIIDAVNKKVDVLGRSGIILEISELDTTYDDDCVNEILGLQQRAVDDYVAKVNLKNTYLTSESARMSSNQKSYIELLRQRDEEDNREKPHFKRYIIIGLAAGIFLVGCVLVLMYIIDSTVKTEGDVTCAVGYPPLQHTICETRTKKTWLLSSWAYKLMKADVPEAETNRRLEALYRELASVT